MRRNHRICFLFLLLAFVFQPVIADEYQKSSRLIIGFDSDAYLALGGASQATDYLNAQWVDERPLSLVRPMGNSAILVEVNNPTEEKVNEIINKLMEVDRVRYVNEDQPVSHFPSTELDIPTFQ